MNLTDATVEDMVAELERRGLQAAVVTAPRAAQDAFAGELRARGVTPLPGLVPPDMTHPPITVHLASRLRSECAVPTIFLLAAAAGTLRALPAVVSAGKEKALAALEEGMKPVSRALFALLPTDDG
jgi:hypothetical protein